MGSKKGAGDDSGKSDSDFLLDIESVKDEYGAGEGREGKGGDSEGDSKKKDHKDNEKHQGHHDGGKHGGKHDGGKHGKESKKGAGDDSGKSDSDFLLDIESVKDEYGAG